jgi:hypothetical protein
MFRRTWRVLPPWVHEGLAEWVAGEIVPAGRDPHESRSRSAAKRQTNYGAAPEQLIADYSASIGAPGARP